MIKLSGFGVFRTLVVVFVLLIGGLAGPASGQCEPTIVGNVNTSNFGRSVTISGSMAYVADGGLQVIDVSNPAAPFILGWVFTSGSSIDVAISGSVAYVAIAPGLRVIDVSDPTNPTIIGSSLDSPSVANSVAISGTMAYLTIGFSGLQVIDVSDPTNPTTLGFVDTPGLGSARGVAISGSVAYVADGSFGLQVIDVSDPTNPFIVGSVETPGQALGIAVSGPVAYMADGQFSGLQVIDVSSCVAACPDEFYGDSDAQDQFGFSVAIDGGTAIVGAIGDDENFSGAAFLYDTTSGTQIAKLHASNGAIDQSFGFSVGISGSTAIVGMDLDETTPIAQSAYLFDATTGLQTHELLANDGLPYDWFGFDVAIDGTTALVGAFGDDDNGESSGSAYLFNANTGIQTFKLLPASGATWDAFGFSVALSGNTVIVGSPFDDDAGQDAGAAYIFDASTGLQLAKLLAPDGAAGDNFGFSVGLDGLTAVIGSPGDGDGWSDSGSAYIFDVVTEAQLHKLHASNGGVDRSFGFSVDISGFRVIVGMDLDETTPVLQSAYLFDATTGVEIQELQACDGSPYDWYGFSVAIDRGKAIVGAFGVGDDAGAAYIHEYEFCAADIDGDGVVNVTDLLALLAAWGPCPAFCSADTNNDNQINVSDLLALLAAWGACP